jgi:hypothetical protein
MGFYSDDFDELPEDIAQAFGNVPIIKACSLSSVICYLSSGKTRGIDK